MYIVGSRSQQQFPFPFSSSDVPIPISLKVNPIIWARYFKRTSSEKRKWAQQRGVATTHATPPHWSHDAEKEELPLVNVEAGEISSPQSVEVEGTEKNMADFTIQGLCE